MLFYFLCEFTFSNNIFVSLAGVFIRCGVQQPLSAAGEGKDEQWHEEAAGAPGASLPAFVSALPLDHRQTERMVGCHIQPYIQPSSVSGRPIQDLQHLFVSAVVKTG